MPRRIITRRKSVFLLSLLFMFTFSGIIMPNSIDNRVSDFSSGDITNESLTPDSNPNMIMEPKLAEIPTSSTGTGNLLHVEEYANGTYPERMAYANASTTYYPLSFDIPSGWYTTSITSIASKMYHLKDWVQNGGFSSITGWTQNWDAGIGSSLITLNYDTVNDWITIVRQNSGKVKYDHYGSWNQSVYVNEGGAASAQLNVTYKIDTTSGTNGQNAQPYLFVNGTIWELPSAGQRFSVNQDWETFSVNLPLSEYTFPGTLDVALGIRGFADTQFQTDGTLTCDNVSLTLRTSRLVEVINLSARDANQITNTQDFATGAGGKGYATLTGNWTNQVELEFGSNETGTEFALNLYMNLERNTELDSNQFSVGDTGDVTWESRLFVEEMGYPFTYQHFNISIPDDWTVQQVYDGFDYIQLSGMTYYNATFYSAQSILLCDVAGTGGSGTAHYGFWKISSTSPNYGDSMVFLIDSGGWTETSIFYPNSIMRVQTTFTDSGSTPPSTYGNTTASLFDAEGSFLSSVSGPLNSTGYFTSSNIVIDPLWLVGETTVVAIWNNGTSAGRITSQFYVHHHTEIEIEAELYTAYRGDVVSVRVKYIDSENNIGIPGADLYYEWNYGSGVMGYAGNGWYAGAVDTSIAVIGGYIIDVNASKAFYDYAEALDSITIEVQEKTTLYSPKNLGAPSTDYEIPWDNTKTIYLAYEDTIAMNPNSITATVGSPSVLNASDAFTSNNVYATVDSVSNQVSITIQTNITPYDIDENDLNSITLKFEGKFSTAVDSGTVFAYNYTGSDWEIISSTYSPTIDTTITWKTSSPQDFISGDGTIMARIDADSTSSFSFNLDLFDFIANRPIGDSAPNITITSDWETQSVVGLQQGPSYNSSLGVWELTLITRGVTPAEYTIQITASATGHQDKSLELTIVVRPHHSRATAAPPSETPWSWNTWINVSFVDTDNSSIIISNGNISSIAVETPFGSQTFLNGEFTYAVTSGRATIGLWLDTNTWSVGDYSITLTVSTTGSGVSKYFDDETTALELTIREHRVSIAVNPPSETPWGWKTNVSLSLYDLDNSSIVGAGNVSEIIIAGITITDSDWTYSNNEFWFWLDTSDWQVSSSSYPLSVIMADSPAYYDDGTNTIVISIRSHILVVSVTPPPATPWEMNTTINVRLLDLDNSSLDVTPDNITQIEIAGQIFTASEWSYSSSTFTCTVDTSSWSISSNTYGVTVTTSTSPVRFYNNGETTTNIEIRSHQLGVTVTPPSSTPWGMDTTIILTLIDTDNPLNTISQDNISKITIANQYFVTGNWTYLGGQFTCVLDTSLWSIDSNSYSIVVTTNSAIDTFYYNTTSSVTITIRSHQTSASIDPPSNTPWGWKTNITLSLSDLDDAGQPINPENITQIIIAGQIFTQSNWTYSGESFICLVDTSDWPIGSGTYAVSIITSSVIEKFYQDETGSVFISISRHTLGIEVIRPPATPWSENTSVTIRLYDVNNESIVVSSNNITQINIGGYVFASWTYTSGEFTVNLTTQAWPVGLSSLGVQVTSSGIGVTKYFTDATSSVTIEIRNRYSEAYAPSPDPVPYLDDLVFYLEFGDRDAGGELVDLDSILINGSSTGFTLAWISEGYYRVTMSTSSLNIGSHELQVTCIKANYENAIARVRFRIRLTDTQAVASGYRFNLPLGNNLTFTIEYSDIDHDSGVPSANIISNGTLMWNFVEQAGGIYQINILTNDSTLLGEYAIRFDLSASNYESAYVIVVVTIVTHTTSLSFDEAVLPTGIGGIIEVYMFYEDTSGESGSVGISNITSQVIVSLDNSITGSTIFTVQNNDVLGIGHYLIEIPASQFGGLYTVSFTVYFNWTGSPRYFNQSRAFNVQITTTATDLSVEIAPQAAYYGDLVNFTLYYENVGNGTGINNAIAYAIVTTPGESILSTDFTVENKTGGFYTFLLDSTLFSGFGSYQIRAFLNWTPTLEPYYGNQSLAVTVTVLIRTTLIDIVPPESTVFGEIATFNFTYYDASNPSNPIIENSTQMSVVLENLGIDYILVYSNGVWMVNINTTSLTPGTLTLHLNVTWTGAPYYQNRTKDVTLRVTDRPTQLTYTAPAPTFFSSEVTIVFEYIDLIDDSSSGMNGSTLTLSSGALILTGNYTVFDNHDGTYTVVLNTSAFLEPGTYTLSALMEYSGSRYESDASVSFSLRVTYRAIVVTSDPIGNTAWLENINVLLHLTDGETVDAVWNTSGAVRIDFDIQNATNPDLLGISTSWSAGSDQYAIQITNTLGIGTHVVYLEISYDYLAPYYGSTSIKLTISIRKHSTELRLVTPASSIGFGLNSTFELEYVDLDTNTAITNAVLEISNSSLAGNWTIYKIAGIYQIEINTTAFDTIGNSWVLIETQNTGPLSNYLDTNIYVRVFVRERHTLLTYDPVGSVGYTENVKITVYYSDTDLGGIPILNSTGALNLSTNATQFSVSNGISPGSYVIELAASQFTPFILTEVQITISYSDMPYYQQQTIIVRFQISGTSTEFAWDPIDPVPYGDLTNLTIYWGDTDGNQPVICSLGDDTEIIVESITQPSLNTSDTNIVNIVPGKDVGVYATFFIIIDTNYLDIYDTYEFRISINWTDPGQAPYYQDQLNKLVSIVVRMRDTAVPQVIVDQVVYGETALVKVQYVDLDNDSLLIEGPNLNITVGDGMIYNVNPTPIAGFYEIYIDTAGTGLLGNVRFNISIVWTGKPFFENQPSLTAIVTINRRVASMETDFPEPTPYADMVSFYIYLQDTYSNEYINNNESFLSAQFKQPSIGLVPSISYIGGGNGQYQITFNSSDIGAFIGIYILEISFNHTTDDPYYALLVRNITGSVRERATTLDYEPPAATPYGNFSTFTLTYTDVDSLPSEGIDSASIYIAGLTENVDYWIQHTSGGSYLVNISTTSLGAPSTYPLSFTINSSDWWFADRYRTINVKVTYRSVQLSFTPPDVTYYDDETFFVIEIIDLDASSEGVGLEGMESQISVNFITPSGTSNATIQINEITNGQYNISFDTGILSQLVDYKVGVSFNGPNYWQSVGPVTVTGKVRARLTEVTYDVLGSTPFLDNVTITLTYTDIVALIGIDGANISLDCGTSNETLIKDVNYWLDDFVNGNYEITIDSSALGDIDTFSISIDVAYSGAPFYQNRSVIVTVEIRERATRLTFTPPTVTPFGDEIVINLRYYDVDAGLIGIQSAESYFSLETINGTPVDSSYYWVEFVIGAAYKLYVNSSKLDYLGVYELEILVSGNPEFHYESQVVLIDAEVRARSTQLTTAPIAQTSYTQNITVTFYYKDIDANIGVYNETVNGGVSVAVNTSASWWVEQVVPGTYRVLILASDLGATGEYSFEAAFSWITGKPFYENQTLSFTVSVTGSSAVMTFVPPSDVPIGDNITIIINYKDAATNLPISNSSGGHVHITIESLNSTSIAPFEYWLEIGTSDEYIILINSTPYWRTGSLFFEVNVTWDKGTLPLYNNVTGTIIRASIRGISTQTFAEAPNPGTVPIGDDVFVIIAYYDLDRSKNVLDATIESDWIYGWEYVVLGDGSFNVTLHTAGIPSIGKYNILFTFNKTFYQTKTSTVSITIRLTSTSSSTTTPEPSIVPIGDTVTFEVTYFDTDHQVNITDADIETDWIHGWSYVRVPGGGFILTLYTGNVTLFIKHTVNIYVNKSTYQTALASVRFEVRRIRTSLTADVPNDLIVGNNVTVTVSFIDLDHDSGIENAALFSDAPGGLYSWMELSGGDYQIVFYLWNQDAGTYGPYDITTTLLNYNPASVTIDFNLRQVRTELYSLTTALVVNWSVPIQLEVFYDQIDSPVGHIADATVQASIGGLLFDLTSNGTLYQASIDTTLLDVGTYVVTVTANKSNYESRITQLTVVLSVLETRFASADGKYSYSVVSGESVEITVYYESYAFGGINGASVTYSWNPGDTEVTDILNSNGTIGYYSAIIDTTGVEINTYTLYVRANKSNHGEASIYFSINVGVVTTDLMPLGETTLRTVFGDRFNLLVNYSNTRLGGGVQNASITFKFTDSNYTGLLEEQAPGIYNVTIDTYRLYAGSFTIYVVAVKPGYETGTVGLILEVARIDTTISPSKSSDTIVYEETVEFLFTYMDEYHGIPIENAIVEYTWFGGTGTLEEIGGGVYRVELDSRIAAPGVYDIRVSASKSNYQTRTTSVTLQINMIQTELIVDDLIIIPVGDSFVVSMYLNDTSYGRPVTGAIGSAIWPRGAPVLNEIGDGNYTFTVPGTTSIDTYTVTFILNKENHTTATADVTLIVQEIQTELTTANGQSFVRADVGSLVSVTVVFTDTDHNLPVTGADINVESSELDEDAWSFTEKGNGEYVIQFALLTDEEFSITVTASKGENYHSQTISVAIVPQTTPQDPLMTMIIDLGFLGIIVGLIAALLYVRVFSVPKLVRIMNGMIKKLGKGKVPVAPDEVRARESVIMEIINEGLEPVKMHKPVDEFPRYSIEFKIPDTEELLAELASITSLSEEDIEVFRKDLVKMKPSERPGFLHEVIKQERARRAKDLAEVEKPEEPERKITETELQDLKEKFLALGIAPEEVDLILENAKELSKAEIEALLDQMDSSDE